MTVTFEQSVLTCVSLAAVAVLATMGVVVCVTEFHLTAIRQSLRDFRRLPWYAQLFLVAFVSHLVVYGSVKTNQTNSAGGDATNSPPAMLMAPRPAVASVGDSGSQDLQPHTFPHWRHGVYEDGQRVGFDEDWVFPFGTSHLSSVEVMSWGEILPNGFATTPIAELGCRVSLVPDASEFHYCRTPSNSYQFVWNNARDQRINGSPISGCIELFRNGDVVVGTNGVVRTVKHVNWFDVDDDGLPDEVDADPQVPDPDGSARWRTLPEGSHVGNYCWVEIVSRDEDALVKFVGDAPSNYTDPCFVARAGVTNRVPILIGKDYTVESSYPVGLVGKSDPEIDVGFRDGGVVSVRWSVSVDVQEVDGGGFRVVVSPSCLVGDCAWTNGCCRLSNDGGVFMYACDNINCSCGGCRAEGYFCYDGYRPYALTGGECGCHPHEEDVPAFEFSVSMPSTVFVNDDDDNDDGRADCIKPAVGRLYDNDVARGAIHVSSSSAADGAVIGDGVSGLDGDFIDESLIVPIVSVRDDFAVDCAEGTIGEVSISDAGGEWTRDFYVSAACASEIYGGSSYRVRWHPTSGPDMSASVSFTAVHPVVEPICSETTNFTVGGVKHEYVFNPSSVVVGKDSYFRIALTPEDYPDRRIVWSFDDDGMTGSAVFVDGDRGRTVRVRGVAAGSARLKIQIGDAVSPPPSFDFRVVTNSTVKVSAWIVADAENGLVARSIESVRNLISRVNDIYSQVGVTFDIGDRISITNIPAAYNVLLSGTSDTMWNFNQLVNTHSGTGGLELYFVNEFYNGNGLRNATTGGNNWYGTVISAKGTGVTLAHEIGHAFGLKDIYISNDEADASIPLAQRIQAGYEYVRQEYMPSDWNGGCRGHGYGGARYYRSGMMMGALIPRLLMYGHSFGEKRDLSLGSVYGVWYEPDLSGGTNVWHKTNSPIGTASQGPFDITRVHE